MTPLKRTTATKLRALEVQGGSAQVVSLPIGAQRTDREILAGLQDDEPWAKAALFDRFAPQVERTLRRLLGTDRDIDFAELIHETFAQALASIRSLRDGQAFVAWIETIASRVAYREVRGRQRRRWLRFWEPSKLPEVPIDGVDPEVREAYRRTLAALDALPARERVPFLLRQVEGWDLVRIAEAQGVSLATIKRRIARGSERFEKLAGRDEVLRRWLDAGAAAEARPPEGAR